MRSQFKSPLKIKAGHVEARGIFHGAHKDFKLVWFLCHYFFLFTARPPRRIAARLPITSSSFTISPFSSM